MHLGRPGTVRDGAPGPLPAPFVRWLRTDRAAWVVVVLSLAAYLVVREFAMHTTSYDLIVYRAEGAQILHGGDLYGRLPVPDDAQATYPPFAAVVFVLFAIIPAPLATLVMLVANLAAVFAASALVLLAVRRDSSRLTVRSTLLFGSVALWSEPVLTTLRFGQVNLLLLCLVLGDVALLRNGRRSGAGIGLAAGIKVTPLIFIAYLALTRRWAAAARALAAFGVTLGVSLAVTPAATWRFWTVLLFTTSRVGRTENALNQSIRGVGARIDHARTPHATVTVLTVAVVVLGLITCLMALRVLGELWAVTVCGVTALVASPIAWSHHWVWCVPVAALIWTHARRWIWVVAPFWSYLVWLVPHSPGAPELHLHAVPTVLSALYPLSALGFLTLTLVRCRRGRRPAPRVPRPPRERIGAGR